MNGTDFRRVHGDPAQWDDDEYEAYLAWTAPQPTVPAPPQAPTTDPQPTTN